MGKLRVTDFITYRWRYYIGYGLVGLALIVLLVIAGLYIPGGLSSNEINSTVKSSSLAFNELDSFAITNLPYHLLQEASLSLFGVSLFTIKLPSLILGFLSAIGMFFLLRRWFRQNIAVIASVLTIATGQFLFVAQDGSPGVLYIFWSVYLLLAAIMIARKMRFHTFWTYSFFIVAALSLYTPLSIYVLFAIISAALLHPHLRYIVKRTSKQNMVIAGAISLLLLVPLVYGIIKNPQTGLALLGIPPTWPDIGENIMRLIGQYIDVISPTSGSIMTPIFSFGSLALITLGIFHIIRSRHTARSYIVGVWALLLIPVLVINPDFISITFVPLLLLLATGVHTLLYEWYRLFPRNPYARVAGLIPLVILVVGLLLSGIERYAYGYHYDPLTASHFSLDLELLNKELAKIESPVTLVTSQDEQAFYEVVATHNQNLTVATSTPENNETFIVTHTVHETSDITKEVSKIVVSPRTEEADRFYLYKNASN